MSSSRKTLGVLVALAAPLGTLGAAATAQASTSPVTLSVIDAGHSSPLATDGSQVAYSNATGPFSVTATGADPSATSASLGYNDAAGTYSQPTGALSNGSTQFAVSSLAAGVDVLSYTDNSTGVNDSSSQQVVVDQAPTLTLSDQTGNPVSDGGTAPSDGYFSADIGIPNEPIALFIDGAQVAAPTADANGGVLSMAPAGGMSVGYHTAYAETEDAQGNYSPASSTLHFYVAPPAPTYVAPQPATDYWPYLDQSEPTFTVSGVEPGATVTLYQMDTGPNHDTNTPIGSVTSAAGGTVAVTATSPVADGFENFTVTQSVSEGTGAGIQQVESDWMDAQTVATVDTAKPVLNSNVYGSLTNNSKPTFTFSVDGVGGDPNAKWRIVNANTGQTLGETGLANYSWSPSTALADGAYSFYAVAIDAAGELSAQSAPISFTVDTVAPSVPSVTSPAAGSTVTTGEPSITVHGDPGAAMEVSIDYGTAGEVDLYGQTADSNGNTTYTLAKALSNGQHTLKAASGDGAGNWSEAQPITFTVNTAPATTGTTTTPQPPTKSTPVTTPAPKPIPAPKPTKAPAAPKSVSVSSHTLSAGHPLKVSFTATQPGTVVLTLTKQVKTTVRTRVKVHGKTKMVTKTITKTEKVGATTVKVTKAGRLSYSVSTKFAGHKLGKGNYTLALRATSGKRTSKAIAAKVNVR